MLSRRGHTCIDYANEGSTADCERVQIFTEAERAGYFGPHDKQKLYHIVWDPSLPYWKEYNRRCVEALKPRVKKGDFILVLAGNCQVGPIGDAFPGSYGNMASGLALVEWGIGYFGTQSRWRVFESNSHREWMMGRVDQRVGDFETAVVPNFFDMDEFPLDPQRPPSCDKIEAPFALFIGRVIADKGFDVAIEATRDAGIPLVIAGQGDPGDLPPHVTFFGHANVEERAWLMSNAVATICATRFREPFGGTAVESQLCGTPAITTDWGAFTETVEPQWRCSTHREFVEALQRAMGLPWEERNLIRAKATLRFSLDAVAPLYERYFSRVLSLWFDGYYEMRDLATLELPPESVEAAPVGSPPSDVCDFAKITDEETPQASRIAQWMKQKHPEKRILDVGCGPGIYVEEMRKVGVAAYGVDNDSRLVESDYLARYDITDNWEKFAESAIRAFPDIVLSLEVGEHIPEAKADAYVDFIVKCEPDLIYFSAARPGQGGNGHINCQLKSYWIEKFHRAGYWLDVDAAEEFLAFIRGGYHLGWLPQNLCIFKRA